jgi:hypothetical protein
MTAAALTSWNDEPGASSWRRTGAGGGGQG